MIQLKKEHKQSLSMSAVIILLFAGCHFYPKFHEFSITIPESKIQETILAEMPLTRTFDNGMDITFNNPKIRLQEEPQQIILSMTTIVSLPSIRVKLSGAFEASSTIRYAPDQKAFFIENITVNNLSILNFPNQKLYMVKDALEQIANQYYSTHPVYVLNGEDRTKALARNLLKRVDIANHAITITLK